MKVALVSSFGYCVLVFQPHGYLFGYARLVLKGVDAWLCAVYYVHGYMLVICCVHGDLLACIMCNPS